MVLLTGQRRSVLPLVALMALALVLLPGVARAATPTCFGLTATIVGTPGNDNLWAPPEAT
jgi:hypothetical protein